MTVDEIWAALDHKLIAILRGIKPEETPEVVGILLEEGFRAIEIPLNSPDAFKSIEIAVDMARNAGPCLVGAGTVLSPDEVRGVKQAGGNLIVSPNIETDVVKESLALGMASFPGVFTATEAHKAVRLGATGLKFFPASHLGASGIFAIKATLPTDTQICAVGGVGPNNFSEFLNVGVDGFGMGSSLYKIGASASDIRRVAKACIGEMTKCQVV